MVRTVVRVIASIAFFGLWIFQPRPAHADARPTVAVLYFSYAGTHPEMSVLQKALAQMLIADLLPTGTVRIVERERLEDILAELKLQQSDLADPGTATKIARILGARYLVLGSYMELPGQLRISARVVELNSDTLHLSSAGSAPDNFLTIEQKVGEDLVKYFASKEFQERDAANALRDARPPTAPSSPATPSPTTPAPATPAPPAQRVPPPAALKTKTAIAYSRALDAIDHKDKARAKKELTAVLKEQPDFRLAQLDMDRLIQ